MVCKKGQLISKKTTKDLTGKVFGYLTVLKPTEERSNGSIVWECQCECGKICYIPTSNLSREHTRSCGCLARETSAKNGSSLKINMIGQRFGRLVVLEEIPYEQRTEKDQPAWLCQCDCGNTYIASGYHLRRGDINSCGCIKRIDITGNKYGKLTAIARDDEFSKNHKFKHSYWHCKCECGNDVTIYLGHLQNGHTTSCGCDKSSKGEKEITQILEEIRILRGFIENNDKENSLKQIKKTSNLLAERNRICKAFKK